MVPCSTKLPSPKRSTRDSSTARSPSIASTALSTPPSPRTVRITWLGATVVARRSASDPGTGPARPVNVSENTSSLTRADSSAPPRPALPASCAVADPGIEIAVDQVDGQVDGHEHHRDEQARALGERVIALVDRPEHEPPEPRQGEDLLDDNSAPEQDAHLEAHHRHDRDQGVLERVLEDDGSAPEALGGGRAD